MRFEPGIYEVVWLGQSHLARLTAAEALTLRKRMLQVGGAVRATYRAVALDNGQVRDPLGREPNSTFDQLMALTP